MKLFLIKTSGSGDVYLRYFCSRDLGPSCSAELHHLAILAGAF